MSLSDKINKFGDALVNTFDGTHTTKVIREQRKTDKKTNSFSENLHLQLTQKKTYIIIGLGVYGAVTGDWIPFLSSFGG